MNQIFSFIFNCLKGIFNFLDFNLPGLSLTYVEFFLLALIIPLIFRLVRGAITESGNDTLFGAMDGLGSISSYSSTQYNNYLKNRYSTQLVFSTKRDDYTLKNQSILSIPPREERIANRRQWKREKRSLKHSLSDFKD